MLASVLLTATMFLTPLPVAYVPPPPLLGQAAEQAEQDQARQWAIDRPNRGDTRHATTVQRAATFPPAIIPKASCVIYRESKGNLVERQSGVQARNPGSSAQGRWQFINNDWQHSLPWHVRDRLVQFGMPLEEANKVRRYLDKRPIYQWNGWWQDIGFIETVVDRDGWHHWDGHGC